jgi:hypothetical protein
VNHAVLLGGLSTSKSLIGPPLHLGGGPIRRDSIVIGVGFLTGGLRLAAILAGGLPVLVSGPTVSLAEIVGHRFGGRLMFLSEPLMHEGYFIFAPGC